MSHIINDLNVFVCLFVFKKKTLNDFHEFTEAHFVPMGVGSVDMDRFVLESLSKFDLVGNLENVSGLLDCWMSVWSSWR